MKNHSMSQARLLIVDDEKNVRLSLRRTLEDDGHATEVAADGEECLRHLREGSFEVVLLDVWLPGSDGLKVLEEIRLLKPDQYVVMISGHGSIETAVRATKLGAFDFLEKPLTSEKTILVVEHALKQLRLEQENRTLKDLVRQETQMIGSSVPMQALRQQIAFAAPTEGRILIYGENGTGKELVARLLHQYSARQAQAFIPLNCAAIPEDLIENELFGSVKGAYTGATEARKGKFELAHGGTLFLDEVGDMSLKTQAKVLRVLEAQRFSPVGGSRTIAVDVRVIAATNQNLEEQIERGLFREDLFFRLNVIPFELPPLRQRKEDIPELLDHFMALYCRRYGKPAKILAPGVLDRFSAYCWPGNVRELRNVVERMVIMVPGATVDLSDLPLTILHPQASRSGPAATWAQAREQFERQFLEQKLRENDGNVSRTAAAIGLERSHLHRKLKAFDIRPARSIE